MKKSHKQPLLSFVAWITASLCVAAILFYRFPNNFFFANFYAEDGAIFIQRVLDIGFFHTVLTPFNGYCIAGIYILAGIAVGVNTIAFDHVLYLPQMLAITSYLFFGAGIALPVGIFYKKIQWHYLVTYLAFASFFPLPSWDYAILGTIGNTKFFFSTIALFFIIGLLFFQPKKRIIRYLYYIGISICAYSNPVVYILVITLAWKYSVQILRAIYKKQKVAAELQSLAFDTVFLEYCALAGILFIQILWIGINGIPEQPAYLNTPFEWSKGIEIFLGRTFLFAFLFPVYELLNNGITICLSLIAFVCVYALGQKKHWAMYSMFIYSIIMMTGLLALTRPGISTFFHSYELPGGPGQFFYPQNIATLFLVFFWLNDVSQRFAIRKATSYALSVLALIYLAFSLPFTGSFGKDAFMQKQGTFLDAMVVACASSSRSDIVSPLIYPSTDWSMHVPASNNCDTPIIQNHQPEYAFFNLLTVKDNFIPGGITTINRPQQSFVSPYSNLSGISVFFSTFGKKITSPYLFTLLDGNCTTIIQKHPLDISQIHDNAFYTIPLDQIKNSKNQSYCFSITTDEPTPATPLTIQMSGPNIYNNGTLKINQEARNDDLVFYLNFNNQDSWIFEDNMQ